jgi:hypothetical protein
LENPRGPSRDRANLIKRRTSRQISQIGEFCFNAHLSNLRIFLTELEKSSDFSPTGCPAWIKPRTFEANRGFSEGAALGESNLRQRVAPSCWAGDRFSRHQFASFASTAVDETTNF